MPRAKLLQWASITYVVLFASLNGLPLTPLGQRLWPLQVIQALGLWLYLPIVILGVANCFWSRRALIWLLVPLTAFVVEYGWCFWPNRAIARPSPQPTSLRLMTWNLHYDNTDAVGIAECIATERPDAIALQEVNAEIRAQLPTILRADYPYQQIIPAYGLVHITQLATFSRFPIAAPARDVTAMSRVQKLALRVGDRALTLYNVHLPAPQIQRLQLGSLPWPLGYELAGRQAGFERLWEHLQQADRRATVLLGDFNSADREANYRRLRRWLRDAFRDRGWGFGLTYPARPKAGPLPWDPIVRIDYIFHSPDLQTTAVRTGEGPGADHRYVVADLQLR